MVSPHLIVLDLLEPHLKTDHISLLQKIINLESTPSTNDYLKNRLKTTKEKLPTLVNTMEQTAGRGRDKNTWISPKHKGLYSSLAFFLKEKSSLNYLPLVAAISVIESLKMIANIPFNLKWPNDIMVEKQKIAGILIENLISDSGITAIMGIGINLNYDTSDFPSSLRGKATSIKIIQGGETNIENLRICLIDTFLMRLDELQKNSFARIIDDANQFSHYWYNRLISFRQRDKLIEGTFQGINHDGSLILLDSRGEKKYYFSGEIIFQD